MTTYDEALAALCGASAAFLRGVLMFDHMGPIALILLTFFAVVLAIPALCDVIISAINKWGDQ